MCLQICDIPQFHVGQKQDCHTPKIIASTVTYESSLLCAKNKYKKDERWHHPDAIIGDCIDGICSSMKHPPTKREYEGYSGLLSDYERGRRTLQQHGERKEGYGSIDNYRKYFETNQQRQFYPLLQPVDFRVEEGGTMIETMTNPSNPTGYHFHIFYQVLSNTRHIVIRMKMPWTLANVGIFSTAAIWRRMCQAGW
jgi:hypothetical protein